MAKSLQTWDADEAEGNRMKDATLDDVKNWLIKNGFSYYITPHFIFGEFVYLEQKNNTGRHGVVVKSNEASVSVLLEHDEIPITIAFNSPVFKHLLRSVR